MVFGSNIEGEWEELIREKRSWENPCEDEWESVKDGKEIDWLMFEEEQDEGGLDEDKWDDDEEFDWEEDDDDEDEWESDYEPNYGKTFRPRKRSS